MKKRPIDPRLVKQVVPYQIRKGDLRKLAIIQAAVELIATRGVTQLTFEAVGKLGKVSKSHVAYHFPSLDELLAAAIRLVYATGQGIVADYLSLETNPKKRLAAYIEGTFHWLEVNPGHGAVTSLLGYLCQVDPRYGALQEEIRQLGVGRLKAILEASGAPNCSELIHAVLVGKALYYLAAGRERGVKKAVEETLGVVDAIVKRRR